MMSTDSVVRIPLGSRSRRGGPQELLPEFFAGPENRLVAHLATVSGSLLEHGNPCLLVGPTGVGKTAIARVLAGKQASDDASSPKVLFESAVEFARRFAEAVEADDLEHFRTRYDKPEVLVIDDVQMIVGKPAAQVELSLRIDARIDKQKAFIATCNAIPLQLRGLRPALASRLLGGLTIPIAPPGEEARRVILEAMLSTFDFQYSEEQLAQIDRSLPPRSTARRLHAALQQITLQRNVGTGLTESSDLTDESIQSAVRSAGTPTIASITTVVAKRFKVRASELRSDTRRQTVVQARSLAMYLSRELTESSLQQIGRYFGGRDHSTVLHALRKIGESVQENPEIARIVVELSDQLRGG